MNYFYDFIESRESVKRPGTIAGYRQSMILFMRFLEQEYKVNENDLSFSHFNSEHITAWLQWLLNNRGNDPATCNLRLAQIIAFFKWLKKTHPEHRNIYTDIKDVERLVTENKTEAVEPISEIGVQLLLKEPGTNTLTGLKYTTMMAFQYGTGTRTDEILSIKIGELNLDCPKPNVMVTGKRRKKRVVNIPAKTVKILKKYINRFHGEKPDPEAYLFYSQNKGRYGKLSESGYNKQMSLYSHKAYEKDNRCPEHIHPHQLRHSWATHSLDHGVPIFQISKALGHESVDTTMRYLGITPNLKNEAMMKTESFVAKNTKVNWRRSKSLEDFFK